MNAFTQVSFAVLALLVVHAAGLPARAKRQDAGTTTTPSPEYTACVNRCPATPEYNPVCGSNRVTYTNESRLRCASQCGVSVRKSFNGSCSPL